MYNQTLQCVISCHRHVFVQDNTLCYTIHIMKCSLLVSTKGGLLKNKLSNILRIDGPLFKSSKPHPYIGCLREGKGRMIKRTTETVRIIVRSSTCVCERERERECGCVGVLVYVNKGLMLVLNRLLILLIS